MIYNASNISCNITQLLRFVMDISLLSVNKNLIDFEIVQGNTHTNHQAHLDTK